MKQLIMEMKRKFERVPLTEKAKPDFLDVDGDGNTTEPWKKAEDDRPECDSCSGAGCEKCKNTGMKPKYQNVEQCTKCKGKGCEHCDGKGYHKKVDEMSTSAGVAPVTGKYFLKDKKQKKKMKYPGVAEAMEKRYERLIEGYRTYATSDPKKSPESKVNETIIEVSKKLREIEESVKNASRLKEESGVTREGYKKRTNKALDAISERLVKISERVRNLMQ